MTIIVTPHSEQEEKVLLAFLSSLNYKYELVPDFGKRQTIAEYNKEIEDAIDEVKAGKFTTQEELEKKMQLW